GAYHLCHQDTDTGQLNQPAEIFVGCGAATLYRRCALEDAGRLDGIFFAYLDDVDLAFRLQLCGWNGMYVPEAVAYHIGSATLGDSMHPRIVRWMTRNQLYCFSILHCAENLANGLLYLNARFRDAQVEFNDP